MRTTLGVALLVLVTAQAATAQTGAPMGQPAAQATSQGADRTGSAMILARVGQFMAGDSAFKDVYDDGLVYGGELRVPIGPGGKRLVLFVDGSYRTHKGELTYTKESTKIDVTGVEGGLLYRFGRGRVSPYIGAGAGYYSLKESSAALGTASKGGMGFVGAGGFTWAATRHLMLDTRVKYSSAKLQPSPQSPDVTFKVDAGGITAGIGLGIAF